MDDDRVLTVPVADSEDAPRRSSLSDVLSEIAGDESRDRISFGDLLDAFGDRAHGALIFTFAAPNLLPIAVPGVSAVLGAPLLFLTWQLALGLPKPWLPAVIRRRSFTRVDFQQVIQRLVPWIKRLERLVRPRLRVLTEPVAERVVGIVSLLLALILVLPIPLGNIMPSVSLTLFSLGILERDGVAVVLGFVGSVVSVALVAGVIYGFILAALYIARSAFGV